MKAPSAFLCVSVLSLHSDQAACGHRLISHCRSLSCKLTNPEVDACLLADIMRQLLFSAKLMFVKVGRSQDLAVCDRSVMEGVVFLFFCFSLLASHFESVYIFALILSPTRACG